MSTSDTTTTYTVYNPNSGTEIARGLDAVQAAQEILGHDSHNYELRREEGCYQLYITRGSDASWGGNGGYARAYSHGRLIYSGAATSVAAFAEIAEQVIKARWTSVPKAMTDEAYDTMLAEIARDVEAEG